MVVRKRTAARVRRWLRVCIPALLLSVGAVLSPVKAYSPSSGEYQVKAAFIYNFAKFVEWPSEALTGDRPFVIGILGRDPFGSAMDQAVAGKTVREKKIAVKRLLKLEDAADCHILFISESEKEEMARILKQLEHAPVLTASDIGQFAEQGGMIQLVVEQSRVRFVINRAAAERVGLKPSSQLLKLARVVGGPAG